MVVLQSGAVAAVGTLVGFALFLAVSALLAARSVFGDAPKWPALAVGAVPAIVGFAATTLSVNPFLALAVALVLDGVVAGALYEVRARLAAYFVAVHFVASVVLGAALFSLAALLASMPG